jgi:hypothetical protein
MQRHVVYRGHLEPDTWQVAFGAVHPTTDTLDSHLIMLIDEIDSAVARAKRSNLLSVFNQLYPDTLAYRRIRLFCLDTDFLQDDSTSLRSADEWVCLDIQVESAAAVILITPSGFLSILPQFAGSVFSFTHIVTI